MSTASTHLRRPAHTAHLHLMPRNRREVLRRRRIAAVLVIVAFLALAAFAWHGVTLLMEATKPAPLCETGFVYLDQIHTCVTQETWWNYHKQH